MHSDLPLRLDRFPSRRFLPPVPEPEGAVARLRAEVAARLGVSPEQVLLGESPDALLHGFMRTMIAAEERVAIAEPCPLDHFRAVIALGGRTVDAGRTAGMKARPAGVQLALEGGARGVIVADPNDPTTTVGDAERLAPVLGEAWMLVDRRLAPLDARAAPSGRSHATLHAVGRGLGALAATPEVVAAVARVMGPMPASGVERAERGLAEPPSGHPEHGGSLPEDPSSEEEIASEIAGLCAGATAGAAEAEGATDEHEATAGAAEAGGACDEHEGALVGSAEIASGISGLCGSGGAGEAASGRPGDAALHRAVSAVPGATLLLGPVAFGWLALRGVAGEALANALLAHGCGAAWHAHHTWRNGVRLELPADPGRVTRALQAAVARLATERSAPERLAPEAPMTPRLATERSAPERSAPERLAPETPMKREDA